MSDQNQIPETEYEALYKQIKKADRLYEKAFEEASEDEGDQEGICTVDVQALRECRKLCSELLQKPNLPDLCSMILNYYMSSCRNREDTMTYLIRARDAFESHTLTRPRDQAPLGIVISIQLIDFYQDLDDDVEDDLTVVEDEVDPGDPDASSDMSDLPEIAAATERAEDENASGVREARNNISALPKNPTSTSESTGGSAAPKSRVPITALPRHLLHHIKGLTFDPASSSFYATGTEEADENDAE